MKNKSGIFLYENLGMEVFRLSLPWPVLQPARLFNNLHEQPWRQQIFLPLGLV